MALCALVFAACPNWALAADQVEELAAFQYYRLALSALERGDLEKAESRLVKATSFASEWAQGGNMLGFVRECLGKARPRGRRLPEGARSRSPQCLRVVLSAQAGRPPSG